ncbi:unnamed protein product [Protopolystoma xenopodis]|uniref:Uncharacterized protein n=1 Tax=Protopolystoma xenopodis TaxID=117903 RepID=A0A3S5A4Y7_9PLAT|nr:unnamed protein product [Protopolystoma xenopodis]
MHQMGGKGRMVPLKAITSQHRNNVVIRLEELSRDAFSATAWRPARSFIMCGSKPDLYALWAKALLPDMAEHHTLEGFRPAQ